MLLPWIWDGTLRQISIVNDLRLGRLQTGALDLAGDTLVKLDLSGNAISQMVGDAAGTTLGALVFCFNFLVSTSTERASTSDGN
jgi:hypothetical protein